MKKLLTIAFALLLSASLSLAQTGGSGQTSGSTGGQSGTTDTGSTKSGKKHKGGHHKGGKKSKKGSTDTTTPPK